MHRPLSLLLIVLILVGVIFITSNALADPGWGDDEPEATIAPVVQTNPDNLNERLPCTDPGWGDDEPE